MTPGDNKDFVRRSNEELYNQKNLRVLDDHFVLSDPEAYKRTLGEYFAAFPDSQMTIEALVAEGDAVGCHMAFRATHLGAWMGIPATGERIAFEGMAFDRIVDGKRVDHAGLGDFLGILRQIGARIVPGDG